MWLIKLISDYQLTFVASLYRCSITLDNPSQFVLELKTETVTLILHRSFLTV